MPWATTRPSLLLRLRDAADDAAWAEFDRRYGELIVRYGLRRGLSLSDAEDVRQVALMDFARAAGGFEYSPQRGRFRNYLGRIVRGAISRQRSPGPRLQALDGDLLAALSDDDAADRGDGAWEEEWLHHHLRLAMQTVRRTCSRRSLDVFGRLLAGDSIREAAGSAGMSEEAVHKIKQRIGERLRVAVAAQLAEEEAAGG